MGRSTISDVALMAGVSEATVSRALRGVDKVSDRTRQKVVKAAESLNFTLSKSASALASGKTKRVQLVVSGELKAWFNASVLQGIYEVLSPADYDVIPAFIMDKSELDSLFAKLPANRNMDALIVASFRFDVQLHDHMQKMGIPTIGLNSPSSDGFDASVGIDDAAGMKLGVQLLKSLGHQRIAFVCDYVPHDLFYSTTLRSDLFCRAALDAGYDEHSMMVVRASEHGRGVSYEHLAAEVAAKILASPLRPTGICVETDEFAVPLLKELRRQHIQIPGDLSVIGFDDAYIAQVSDLTTVRQDPVELGHKAAIKALGLMRGETLGHPHESIAPELVLRETTGRPR